MGNARAPPASKIFTSVHPHVHGERGSGWRRCVPACGSSPRTWGTHRLKKMDLVMARFIPTYMGNAVLICCSIPMYAVHPHVHGERVVFRGVRLTDFGSSPRTWGTLLSESPSELPVRFIPTYMGNAASRSPAAPGPAVHPHVHGERVRRRRPAPKSVGSSPRTWGTLSIRYLQEERDRFIPTYMGNAEPQAREQFLDPVHPHVHGERRIACPSLSIFSGSSPRTWGTQHIFYYEQLDSRFIPTYMGNAELLGRLYAALAVHPHVHGERVHHARPPEAVGGSSPRTWGTRLRADRRYPDRRFIPTYMGNADDAVPRAYYNSVHPHVHGERPDRRDIILVHCGSSPRTWGTHLPAGSVRYNLRFIPTYMGNAASAYASAIRSSVHPHIHGERSLPDSQVPEYNGSSPRTWGTRDRRRRPIPRQRFIPTYMGNA